MGRLDHHCYTFRIEMTPDAIGDFRRQPLLNLQPPGKGVEHTRQLRYPNHMVARQISNMGHADDRCHVVFAMRLEGEIGRASCRERVCQYVWISVVAVTLKKKQKN